MKLRALILLLALLWASVAYGQLFKPWPIQQSMCQPGDPCCNPQVASSPASGRKVSPQPAVVQVVSMQGGQSWIGSGVLVTFGTSGIAHVLTAAHVIPPRPDSVSVVFRGGYAPVAATVVIRDETLDLALLAIPKPAIVPYTIASRKPRLNEILWASGYAGTTGRVEVVSGRLLHFVTADKRDDKEALMLAGDMGNGASGGAIINAGGELVGIVSASSDGVVIGTHCVEILKFLARAIGEPSIRTAPLASPATEPPPQPMAPMVADHLDKTATDAHESVIVQPDDTEASIAVIGATDTLPPSAGPTLLETALPAALAALGWTALPSVVALFAARFGWAAWRRRKARKRTSKEDRTPKEDRRVDKEGELAPPVYRSYAQSQADIYANQGGRDSLWDQTLGRLFDLETQSLLNSQDDRVLEVVGRLRDSIFQNARRQFTKGAERTAISA